MNGVYWIRIKTGPVTAMMLMVLLSLPAAVLPGQERGNPDGDAVLKEIATGGRVVSVAWGELNNRYFFASRDKYLYSYGTDGGVSRGRLEGRPLSGISEGADGKLYLFLENRVLQAMCPGGAAAWAYPLEDDPVGNPVTGPDGTIYMVTAGKRLMAISPAGVLRWELPLPAEPVSSPLLFPADGAPDRASLALVAVCQSGRSYAFSLEGKRLWQFVSADTAVVPRAGEERLFLPTGSSTVTAVGSKGTLEWEQRLSSPARLSALGIREGKQVLYILEEGGMLSCFSGEEGKLIWSTGPVESVASMAAAGEYLLLSSFQGGLVWIDREGKLFHRLSTSVPSGPVALGPGGSVLLGGRDWIFTLYTSPVGVNPPDRPVFPGPEREDLRYTIMESVANGTDMEAQLANVQEIGKLLESKRVPVPSFLPAALELFATAGVLAPVRQEGRVLNDFPEVRIRALDLLSRYGRACSSTLVGNLLTYEWDSSVRTAAYTLLGRLLSDPEGRALVEIRRGLARIYRNAEAEEEVAAACDALIRVAAYHGGPEETDLELLLGVAYGPFSRNLRSKILNTLRQGGEIRLY